VVEETVARVQDGVPMFLQIKQLAKRLVERLREALDALPLSGPRAPQPVPVPVRPERRSFWMRRALDAGSVALAGFLVVAATATTSRGDDTLETPCAVCRVWDASMHEVPEERLVLEAHAIENGVVLRATSLEPEVRTAIWAVSSQRQELLQLLHQGESVSLCPSCQANLQSFDELRIDMVRLPDGVLLLYTSAQPDIVRRLHQMVTGSGLFL
jgi:hypothetical protein